MKAGVINSRFFFLKADKTFIELTTSAERINTLISQTSNRLNKTCCFFLFFLIGLIFVITSFPACSPSENEIPRFYTYKIINTFPHDHNAFTQGLVFEDGFFYESTGRNYLSSVRKVDPVSGEIIKIHELEDHYFGEGLTIVGNQLIQLTWRKHRGFVYDKNTFALLKQFKYQTEGWGLTYDGKRLIMSDGTATLYFLNPVTFKTVRQITVSDEEGSVTKLNELEFIKGEIYANVWKTNTIVRIDPIDGDVIGSIDLTGLNDFTDPVDVLNGIAYDALHDRIFVTGKLWPKIFQIELEDS
jgi:glutamine cyclotransferase